MRTQSYFSETEAKAFVAKLQEQYPSFSFWACDMGDEMTDKWIVGMWKDYKCIYTVHSEQEWNRFVEACHCLVADRSAVSPSQQA